VKSQNYDKQDIDLEVSQGKGSSTNDVRSTTFNSYSITCSEQEMNFIIQVLMTIDVTKHSVSVLRAPLRGYLGNFFTKTSTYRVIKSPHSIQNPGYSNESKSTFRHQDSLGRVYKGSCDDRFLDPLDGKVKELIVQCTDSLYRRPMNSTYKRTFIRNVSPITLQIANWPMSHLDAEPKSKSVKLWARFLLAVKWPITCYVLNHLVSPTLPGHVGPLHMVHY
jgi:hypothetical protein